MAGRFIRLPKHRSYNVSSRYYDEQKELMEERRKRLQKEIEEEQKIAQDPDYEHHLRGHMRGMFKERQKISRQSNLRVILVLLALCAIVYLFFFKNIL